MSDEKALRAREKQELAGESTRPGPVFQPDVDILERPEGYLVYADLPGVDDKSVDVRLDRGMLTLDAQLSAPLDAGWTPLHTEFRFGSYHRSFRLSDEIDRDRVQARMRDGVLELQLPRLARHQPRSIPVQAG